MALYSNSRLSTYEQCPLKFKFSYIDKIETEIEQSIELFLGDLVHQTLEKLYTDIKFQKLNELKELIIFFNDLWKKNWNESIIIVKQEYKKENYRKMGEKYIKDYYNRYKPFNKPKTIGIETKKIVPLNKDYSIHIRIDRLTLTKDNVYEIHDYKTNNHLPDQESLDNDRQLAIYAYGIKKMYPDAKKVRLIWHFLAFDKEMVSERTSKQLIQLKKEILELIHEIETAKEFPANETTLCSWCQFRPECPKFKHLYRIENKPVNEYLNDNGVKLVNEYLKIYKEQKNCQQKLEKLKEAIITYAKKESIDIVYGSDIKASVNSYETLRFPGKNDEERSNFIKAIKKAKLMDKIATIDVHELEKMIKNNEINKKTLKKIERFIEKTTNIIVRLGKNDKSNNL